MNGIIDELKNYLDITWELSESETSKLSSMIERGKIAIRAKVGDCNFDDNTQEKTLLFTHVMYERAGALDEFWRNYQPDIVALQMDRWVKNAENKE